jgi:hypothetical protein
MGWPSPGDYNGAIQNPQAAFRDPRLKECAVELKPGKPWPWPRAGANAIVYRLSNGSGSTAVRVFMNAPKTDRQARYEMVGKYLLEKRPSCTVEFRYEPEGILVGQWLPILTMDWVEGKTLGSWFREAVERQDSPAIKKMAHAWIKLMCELRGLQIAHCDLQHGNVMVVGERLVLVDYDGMYVPDMGAGDSKNRVAWENGLPAYQHPGRPGQLLSPTIDHFSAWIILISLRAVADDLSLWHRTIGATEDESLLFTERDLKQPDRSKLWPELINSARDRKVREWTAALRASLDRPFEEIPPFELDIFDPVREVIKAGDWRQIHALASSQRFANETFPADVAPKVNEAITRVDCALLFEESLESGNLKAIARAYNPRLLDDWLDPAIVARGRQAKTAMGVMDELARAEQKDPAGRELIALWDARARELQGVPEADAIRKKVDVWRKRIAAAEKVDQTVRKGGRERDILDSWHAVEKLGGHPDAEPHRGRAEKAAKCLKALEALAALPPGEDEASDRALLKTWSATAETLAGCAEAETHLERARGAKAREKKLVELKKRIDLADHGQGSERAVIDAAAALPPRYGANLADRIRRAKERVAANTALDQAMAATHPSDLAIADAAERARAGGTWPADPAVAERCLLAIRRRDLLRVLDAISPALPLDQQDAQWTASWNQALLADCADAREQRARHAIALARNAAFAELERGLESGDAIKVKRLARDAILADHPGPARRKAEIDALIAKSEQVERLLAAARAGHAEAFLAEAEPGLLAAHATEFSAYRAQIAAWIDQRLRQGDILRPADPMFLADSGGNSVTARWAWAQSQLVRRCLVAFDTRRFLDRPEEATRGTVNLDPDTHRRSKGGSAFTVPAGSAKLYVTVWPVVDLGWDQRIGPPFRIGPYSPGSPGGPIAQVRTGQRQLPAGIRNWLERLLNS